MCISQSLVLMKPPQKPHPRNVYLRRAVVLTGCLVAIALVITTAYWASKLQLPDPATADREGLVRWLVLRDLQQESPEVRATLLRRLEEEARRDLDPASFRLKLDRRYQEQLWANTLTLIEIWYSNRVDAYQAASATDRSKFLDETIIEIMQWKSLAALQPEQNADPSAVPSDEIALLKIFAEQVAIWKERASPQRRKEITEFDAALRGRWMLHTFGLAGITP